MTFSINLCKLLPLFFLIGIYLPPVQAETVESEEARQERLENSVREIGLSAGYATQCYENKKDEAAVERVGDEALAVAEIILQDFGSTLAFLFTGNAGYGAGKAMDLKECDKLIQDWQELVDEFSQEDTE